MAVELESVVDTLKDKNKEEFGGNKKNKAKKSRPSRSVIVRKRLGEFFFARIDLKSRQKMPG